MKRTKGGSVSAFFHSRLFVSLLLCANVAALGLVVLEAVFKPNSSVITAEPSTTISCDAPSIPQPPRLPISVKQPGLTQVTSNPLYYDVYGTTTSQIAGQLTSCPVLKGFVADTSYTLHWQTSYRTVADGQCVVDKVAVGLHVRHTYPHWKDASGAPAEAVERWQDFMSRLHLHEEEHAALATRYAAQLLQTLQNTPTQDCFHISTTAEERAARILDELRQANERYDARTGHGRTQGAILR